MRDAGKAKQGSELGMASLSIHAPVPLKHIHSLCGGSLKYNYGYDDEMYQLHTTSQMIVFLTVGHGNNFSLSLDLLAMAALHIGAKIKKVFKNLNPYIFEKNL